MRALRTGALALALVLGVATTGCSSDKNGSAPTTTAPEQARTTPAKVAAGLGSISATAGKIAAAAGTDQAEAERLVGDLEPAWRPVEGTVKANDQDTYLAFEDAFAVLEKAAKDGDAAAAAGAAKDISTATASYLKAYPA